MKEEVLTKNEDSKKNDKKPIQQKEPEKANTLFKKVEDKPKKQEKSMKDMGAPKKAKRKKGLVIGILIAVLIIIAIAVSTIFAVVTLTNEKL